MDARLIEAKAAPVRYDGVTIAFHWATAILVLALFASILTADYAPRDWHWHHTLENFHVGLGILFAAVLIGRLGWRITLGRILPAADHGIQDIAAKTVHVALYGLLLLQMSLGFLTRWFQGEEFSFFGLFTMPPLFPVDRDFGELLESIHNYVAWIIIFLAAGHAVAALGHHFITGDGVLRRMLPGGR
jgi:cytochrome b561